MGLLNNSEILILLPSLMAGLLSIYIVILQREKTKLRIQLTRTKMSLQINQKKFNSIEKQAHSDHQFQSQLKEAELTTQLQTTRLKNNSPGNIKERGSENPSSAPEKYQYIQSLAEKGLSPEEIASAMSISTHEAFQLVALSKLGTAS